MGVYRNWTIELGAKTVGTLENPQYDDMFWDRYDIVAGEGYQHVVTDLESWQEMRFTIRDSETGEPSDGYICSGNTEEYLLESQIVLRGLYTPTDLKRIERGEWMGKVLPPLFLTLAVALVFLFGLLGGCRG